MIKDFETFNEGLFFNKKEQNNQVEQENSLDSKWTFLEDRTTGKKYDCEVIDKDIDAKYNDRTFKLDATIFVLPDDSVEAMTISNLAHVHVKVEGLTGRDVRKGSLHRNEYFLHLHI